MTITAADIKIGMCIEMDGKTFLVVDFQHCKPGKGPAFVRSKLKNLENGRVLENTFSSVSQKIEQVRVERRPYQFTYEDDLGAHFMHTETFEEINIDKNLINNYDLITDGQVVEVMFHTEKETVLSAELPPIVDMEVIYTEPGIKGDTAYQKGSEGKTPSLPFIFGRMPLTRITALPKFSAAECCPPSLDAPTTRPPTTPR